MRVETHGLEGRITMDLQKFTERAQGFIQSAAGVAVREGHPQITPEHILKVILDDEEGLAAGLIKRAGGNPQTAHRETEAALAKLSKVGGSGASQPGLARDTSRVLDEAEQIAKKAGDSFVTVERILLALAIGTAPESAKILKDAGVTPQKLNEAINDLRKGRTADSSNAEAGYDALKKYARD